MSNANNANLGSAQMNPNEIFVDGPLPGYRVLEMGSTVAGPFCGQLLADFGVEVIKVGARNARQSAR